jgi:cation transport ATPase
MLRALPGIGVEATVDGRPAFVGKADHAIRLDQTPAVAGRLAELEGQGTTAVLVADGSRPLGLVAVPTSCARRPPAWSPSCTSSASTGW